MVQYYNKNPQNLHIGCMNPRAYFVPFADGDNSSERENSSFFTLLNGEWDFRYFENIYLLDLNEEGFPANVCFEDKMTVPGCWEAMHPDKYDAPQYINQDYPFPVDPPELPDVIPCGLYRDVINFSKKNNKKYFINFEGVAPCFYLWINGEFVAYSQVSHCTSEIDITDNLIDGRNEFFVLVAKYCDGSYMEDQDFFRLCGIFRDVYILEREENRIEDVFIKNYVAENLDSATVDIDINFVGNASASYVFKDNNGREICKGKTEGKTSFAVKNPVLWNPEKPYLYTLTLICGEEIIKFDVGIRRFEIKDSTVLLNGVKIKSRGINRHDSHPETGYSVTVDDMMTDLRLMKAAGVNMIRTSHYPNDPRFYELCDRFGFMLVDEADLECHGMGYNYGDWYWDYWAFLCDDPAWKESCLDRAQRMFERDKNKSCVVLWSLGNESGCGENHRLMANYIRSRDDRALIHYENARLEYEERVGGRDFKDISDVESRMYASIDYLKEYLADDSLKKPFFYCEYVCSMSTGDVYRHWDGVEDNDKYFGGCIWEWCDHAVNIGTKENPRYRYGGDFGEEPNDNYSCVDGLVFPDRTPRPGYFDMKKVYRPFYASFKDGRVYIKNRLFYSTLGDYYYIFSVEKNGYEVIRKKVTDTDILPGEEKAFSFEIPEFDTEKDTVTLNVYLVLKEDKWYEKAGFEAGFEQIILNERNRRPMIKSDCPVNMTEDRLGYTVVCDGVTYRLSKIDGLISSIEKDGIEYLTAPLSFGLYRCTNYNSRGRDNEWKRARFDRVRHHVYRTFVQGITPTMVAIRADIAFAAAAMPPAVKAEVSYVFSSTGMNVVLKWSTDKRAPALPRFGLDIRMPARFDRMDYFGYGPIETYADRFKAGRLSRFSTTVDNNFVHYIKPQENGAHYSTREACLTDADGNGLEFFADASEEFCFNATHFTDYDLRDTLHDDELVPNDFTRVTLDYKIDASSYADEEPWRKFFEKQYYFDYRIKVKEK